MKPKFVLRVNGIINTIVDPSVKTAMPSFSDKIIINGPTLSCFQYWNDTPHSVCKNLMIDMFYLHYSS